MNTGTARTVISKNSILAFIWRLLTVAACVMGLYPLLFGETFSEMSLSYFTTQSNILVAVLFLVLAVGTAAKLKRGSDEIVYHIHPVLQIGIVFFIQITFLVYATMLSGSTFSMGGGMAISTVLLHYVVPIMALFDWIMFVPHGQITYKHAGLWVIYPAAYLAFCFIRAELGPTFYGGSRFPYFFMDADVLGLNLLWIGPLFFAGFFGLGCLMVKIDKLIYKRLNK